MVRLYWECSEVNGCPMKKAEDSYVWAVFLRRHRLNCKDLMPVKKKKKPYKLPSYVHSLARLPDLSDVLI